MAFSRNSMVAAVAGSISLAVLTGCPTPVAPGTGTSPSVAPTTGTSAAPSTGTSASPSTPVSSASPGTSASPSVTPSASPLVPTTVRGTIFDEDGARVSSAKVRVRSLNPSNPFDSTVDVNSGSYVVNEVPAGVSVEITASREGWTSRTRVQTLLPLANNGGESNEVNFGGPADEQDGEGPAYFISDFPEVAMVEPADDADNVNPATVSVKLTLSEALDSTNQRRFADAIRVFAGQAEANGTPAQAGATFLGEDEQATAVTAAFTAPRVAVSEDSTFLGDDDTQAEVTWDTTGTVATLTFNAPLLADDSDNLDYVVALVSNGQAIEDRQGNELGTDENAQLGTPELDAGSLIQFAFREPSLAVPAGTNVPTTEDARWVLTHENFSTFSVAEDETEPSLVSVAVSELTGRTRISLTFSEPMAAFGGADAGIYGNAGGVAINNADLQVADATRLKTLLTFAVAETAAELEDVDLDGEGALEADVSGGGAIGADDDTRETELFFNFDATSTGSLAVNPDDPKTLRLEINNEDLFNTEINAIKVRVEGFADPAGNSITETQADNNQKVGNI